MRINIGDGFELVGVESAEELLLVPPCANASADHATCTWWEDAERGSKAVATGGVATPNPAARASTPAGGKSALAAFLGADEEQAPAFNPFAPEPPTREEALRDAAAAPGQPP